MRSTLAVDAIGNAPVPGNVVMLPIGCIHEPPAFLGAEWLADTSHHGDPGMCAPALLEGLRQRVISSLAKQGFQVVESSTPLTVQELDKLDATARARVIGELGVSGVVRVAVAQWHGAARVTIAIATPAAAYAKIVTCKVDMFSNAAADVVDLPADEVLNETASCAEHSLRGER